MKIRTRLYEKFQEKTRKLSPALWDAICFDLRCGQGYLHRTNGAAVEAKHAVTGKIPILCTETALRSGVERAAYDKFLRWHGKNARSDLWWPLLKARRVQRGLMMMRLMMRADLRRRMANDGECSPWRLMASLAFGRM